MLYDHRISGLREGLITVTVSVYGEDETVCIFTIDPAQREKEVGQQKQDVHCQDLFQTAEKKLNIFGSNVETVIQQQTTAQV